LKIRLHEGLEVTATGASIRINDADVTVTRSKPFVLAQYGGMYMLFQTQNFYVIKNDLPELAC